MMGKSRRMKSVVMFDAAYPPPVIGGKEKQAHLLSIGLLNINVKVQVISFRHNGSESQYFEGIKIKRLKSGVFRPLSIFLNLLKSRLSASILHIHTPSRIGRLVAVFGKLIGFSIVFKFPGQSLIEYKSFLDRISWDLVFRCSDALVVLESDTYQALLRNGNASSRIRMMVNGVVLGLPIQFNDKSVVQLLFVGRLVELKRCVDLIHACSILKKKDFKFSLKIVGDGPERQSLKNIVQNLDLEDDIIFEGYREDTLSIMSESDVLVLPSRTEGMSNVILEAMSIGLPVVATNVGATGQLLGGFGRHFVVPPLSPVMLSKVIEKIIGNKKLRYEYSRYLYFRCKERFSVERIAEDYNKMYDEF